MHYSKKLFLSLFLLSFSFFLKAQDIHEDLLEAVQDNNFTKVQEYISKGADVNFKDDNNASILLWATYKMDLPAVKFLVSKGAKVLKEDGIIWLNDKKESYYGSLLAIVAAENKLDILQYFLEEHKIPVDIKELSPYQNTYVGWTALQWASYKGHTSIVKYLIKNKTNIQGYTYTESPLYYTLVNKKEETALALIQSGADVNPKDNQGYSPLYLATFYDLQEVVKAIIHKKGYEISDQDILEVALERGNLEIFEMLVKKKAPLDKAFKDGSFALHQAAKNGYVDIVSLLLSKKFPINQVDKFGNTALMYAANNNQTKICKILVDKGLDKNIKNNEGQTALDFATKRGMTESIDFLSKGIYKEPDTWISLNQDAVRYYNQGKIEKASEAMEKACFYVAQKSGEDSEDYATALHNYAKLKNRVRNYQLAETLFLKSLKIREKNNSDRLNESFSELANNFYSKGNYTKALEYYLLLLKRIPENSLEYASTLDYIGNMYYLNSSFKASEEAYRKSLDILRKQGKEKSADYAITLGNLGNLLQDMARYNEAKDVYKETLNILNAQTTEYNPDKHLTAINNYADLLIATGEYRLAELLLQEYILNEIPKGKDFSNKSSVLNNLGILYLETNQLEKAEKYLQESLDLKRKEIGENHPKYLNTLNALADIYLMKREYPKAEALYKKILKQVKKTLSEKHPLYLNTLNSLAQLYNETAKNREAENTYLKILELSKDNKETQKSMYASYLYNIGMFYINIKKYSSAESHLREALSIRKEVLGDKHLLYYYSLFGLAKFYFSIGNLKESQKLFKETNALSIYLIRTHLPYMSEKGRVEFIESFQDNFSYFSDFAMEYSKQDMSIIEDLYNTRLATKAFILNIETNIHKKAQNSTDSTVIQLYQSYLQAKDELNQAFINNSEGLQKKIDLVENLELNLGTILNLKPDSSSHNITWKDIQKKLKPNEAAIEVVRLELRDEQNKGNKKVHYIFLILKSKGLPEIVKIENGNELESTALKYFLNSIQYKKEDKFSYNLYWAKVAEKLKDIKSVYISPDHIYTQINLNTLKNISTKKFLYEEVDIILLNNLKDLFTLSRQSKATDAIFFGYPNYQLSQQEYTLALNNLKNKQSSISPVDTETLAMAYENSRNFSSLALSSLPGTKIEVEAIENMFKKKGVKTQTFIGEFALEEAIKTVKNPKVLHIATHGYFLSDIENNKDNDQILGIKKSILQRNVLLRSGLMLTGAESNLKNAQKTNTENGILTAQEAMNLSLSETELVVLSACETGLGEIKTGEGVYGLQRAFKIAGAKAILMSLWKVDDDATKELMISFYDNWLKTNNKKQAFKLAQTQLRAKYPHPYYWGAFILIGE